MKKSSLMGASVVAAALLAAAPVVAPVASLATPGTQVVKADTQKDHLKSYVNKLVGTFKGSTITGPMTELPTNAQVIAPSQKEQSFDSAFNTTTGVINYNSDSSFNKSYTQVSGVTPTADESNALGDLMFTVEYNVKYNDSSNSSGKLVTPAEVTAAINSLQDANGKGGTLTVNYTFYDKHDSSFLGSASPVLTFKPAASKSITGAFVTVNDINVSSDVPLNYLQSVGSFSENGGQILNEKGENIISSLNSNQVTMDPISVISAVSHTPGESIDTGSVLTEGTYRQGIIFDLENIFGTGNVDKAEAAGLVSFNGYSLNEIQKYNLANIKYDSGNKKVTVYRKITIGNSNNVTDAPYTAEKLDGVVTVTTKEGTAAQVYDQAGNPVYSRALAPGSRWVTGQKRTLLKNGKVYYQVSTNEFLSADDVSYTANSASSSEHLKGAVKVTQIGNKVFTIADGNYGYVWAKDDDNNGMHLVKSRFLAPNSKWQSGAKANMTDSDGNTHEFYQVSTNEWIDGSVGSIN